MTTSLRGVVNQVVRVKVLEEAVHSGTGSGIVPSSFRVMRMLLSRLEDEQTGRVRVNELWVDVPPHRVEEVHSLTVFVSPWIFITAFLLCFIGQVVR